MILVSFIESSRGDGVVWSNTKDLTPINAASYGALYVNAGSGYYDGTSCNIAVGIFTAAGGFGCVIEGGVPKGDSRYCEPGLTYPVQFRIRTDAADEFGVFVAQEQNCADGIMVKNVWMESWDPYDPNLPRDYDWTINQFIKASTGVGTVYKTEHGSIKRIDAYVSPWYFELGPAAKANPSNLDASIEITNNDHTEWNMDKILWVVSGVLNALLMAILIWMCLRNKQKDKMMKYDVVKGECTSDEDEKEDERNE